MKFITNAHRLRDAISLTRPGKPGTVEAMAQLTVNDDGTCTVQTYTAELQSEVRLTPLSAATYEPGTAMLSRNYLLSIFKALKTDGTITLQTEDGQATLNVNGQIDYTLPVATDPDIPWRVIDKPECTLAFTGSPTTFAAALQSAASCAGSSDFRTYLNAVHLAVSSKLLIVEGSDSHLLSTWHIEWPNDFGKIDVLLPRSTAQLFGKYLAGLYQEQPATLSLDANAAVLTLGGNRDTITLTSGLLVDTYPDTRSIIRPQLQTTICPSAALHSAVTACIPALAEAGTTRQRVRLDATTTSLTVTAIDDHRGTSVAVPVPHVVGLGEATMWLNPHMLLTLLDAWSRSPRKLSDKDAPPSEQDRVEVGFCEGFVALSTPESDVLPGSDVRHLLSRIVV